MNDRLDCALYPSLEPYAHGHLNVGAGLAVYWEEAGTPHGPALCVVHGGPGGAIAPYYRQLFDPNAWRAILFEQRGCGRSTPHGGLVNNTTADLVADMEALRIARGVERWVVLGGSWGSTLALAYAQTHPDRCAGVIVSGVYLARAQDRDWWWRGAGRVFPELWHDLVHALPDAERSRLREAYIERILHPDPAVHTPAVAALLRYETQLLDLWPNPARLAGLQAGPNAVAMGRLYAHYEAHCHFMRENQLIDDARAMAGVPGWIINGRYDAITPPGGAFDLAQAWPEARLRIVPCAAHVWNDPILSYVIGEALTDLLRRITP